MKKDLSKDSDLMIFKEDIGACISPLGCVQLNEEGGECAAAAWRILITDDDQDVHSATEFALRGLTILGRPLEFYHAASSTEALDVLRRVPEIAVVLLDVVMETSNAGLDCVVAIRDQLKLTNVRIILRTGEPNQAPEIDVIRDYDINDYKLKSELTQKKLFATLTTALRSYQQIRTIEASKKGLDMILRASSELLTQQGLQNFSQGVIVHLAALMDVPPEGIICVRRRDRRKEHESLIIAGAGPFYSMINRTLSDLGDPFAQDLLQQSLEHRRNVFHDDGIAVYLGSDARDDMSCFIKSTSRVEKIEQHLLEIFCNNISVCADNITFIERVKTYAYTDSLVGLPNRIALEEAIDRVMADEEAPPYSLALIDIDNFAEINAALGQQYGDKLLKASSERIKNRFYDPSTVARIGGDTFAVFGPSSHIQESRLLQPFVDPFEIGGELQILSVTAGIVPLAEIDGGGGEAIKDASIVLKKAKNKSRGQVIMFHRDMVCEATHRLDMLKNLRSAFELNELFLVYQPKLRLATGEITGLEALIRWRDGQGQFISPAQFIPLAEQSGLIVRMGEWILRTAIAELRQLRRRGYDKVHMAVNLSVAQLEHPDVLNMLEKVIGEGNIDPRHIELEITESVAMGDMEANLKRLNAIRAMGFHLSIDDFGTGFSSLNYLQKMPINCLKIDRSFVNTSSSKSGREIVEMIVQLGRTLELNIVAEGVEIEDQVTLLEELGCDEVQGFLYARPMPSAELYRWLEDYHAKRSK